MLRARRRVVHQPDPGDVSKRHQPAVDLVAAVGTVRFRQPPDLLEQLLVGALVVLEPYLLRLGYGHPTGAVLAVLPPEIEHWRNIPSAYRGARRAPGMPPTSARQ